MKGPPWLTQNDFRREWTRKLYNEVALDDLSSMGINVMVTRPRRRNILGLAEKVEHPAIQRDIEDPVVHSSNQDNDSDGPLSDEGSCTLEAEWWCAESLDDRLEFGKDAVEDDDFSVDLQEATLEDMDNILSKCITQKDPKYGSALYLKDKIADKIDTMTKTEGTNKKAKIKKEIKGENSTRDDSDAWEDVYGNDPELRAAAGNWYFKEAQGDVAIQRALWLRSQGRPHDAASILELIQGSNWGTRDDRWIARACKLLKQ